MPGVRSRTDKIRVLNEPERKLPHNLDAERFALGSVLVDKSAIEIVNTYLAAWDFSNEAHREIYRAFNSFIDGGSVEDIVTVSEYLSDRGLLDKCGGAGYVSSLMDGVPRGVEGSLREQARIIKRHSQLRRIMHISQRAASRASEAVDQPESIAEATAESLAEIVEDSSGRQLVSVAETLKSTPEILNRLAGIKRTGDRIPTGFTELDELVNGFGLGEMIVLAARPSMGKTALGISMALNAAENHCCPVAFFSLEMGREAIILRALCLLGSIDSQKVRNGGLSRGEAAKAFSTLARIAALPIWIDETSSIKLSQIRSRVGWLKKRFGLGLVVIDYLQLMGTSRQFERRVDAVTHLSQGLKGIAKDFGVPVLALSQLSRAPEGKVPRRPQLSDLRDSGSIEQDADIVMLLWKKKERAENEMTAICPTTLIVAKQRNGPTGDVPLIFLKEYARFEDCQEGREGR